MSTLPIKAITTFARGGVKALTTLAISTATSAITRALDTRVFEGPRLESFHLQTSRDGAPMPRVFGRVRLAGQVIWASQVRETASDESVGGKGGGPTRRNYSYSISFAVGLCEGEILGIDRIWANGEILSQTGLTIRVHTGSDTQTPDPVIDATEPGVVPAFRGTAYIVFEDFPLDDYGARLPIINAEIVRGVRRGGRLEDLVQSVNLLPGTGEFALSPIIIEEMPAIGVTTPTNMNSFSGQSDLMRSLDQLQAELPNCRHVNIISAWFGSSLDAGTCLIRPGTERRDRQIPDAVWQVAGKDRSTAYLISTDESGRPNYGGTPGDDSLIACIQELKRRGFSVTLYPFLLMDMDGFPWRGRIAAETSADVQAFFGTDEDESFRHHILHHARLAQLAGGVDAIVIGSELKTLMAFRDGETFPAVAAMQTLAGDVRSIVGPLTTVTYAADWSDYFGVQDGGDVRYHLDPLWADPNIDAVGIDAYFPLSDWRDGDHLDATSWKDGHDPDYLAANVEGGEGYDWYYASAEDRDAQIRSPINDPVYRYKDIRSWWSSPHYERRDGVQTSQSAWVPRSKPIWLLEVGCPAVNNGANQPNVFFDEKSVDAALPYHSDGSRDDLIQRRYIEALLGHYAATNEPGFLDLSRASVWAWDARPYPDFPARSDVWADGGNWARGHWLNGRTGLMPVADVIEELARDSGLEAIDLSGVSGVLPGYVVDRPMSARAAIAPLLQLFDLKVSERSAVVAFSAGSDPVLTLDAGALVHGSVQRRRGSAETRIRDVRLTYIDAARDYQIGTASARQLDAESVAIMDLPVPACLDEGFARFVAERMLNDLHAGQETLSFALPLQTGLTLDIGDRVSFDGEVWAIDSLETSTQIDVIARKDVSTTTAWVAGATPGNPDPIAYAGAPQLLAFDLPGRNGLSIGALLDPWSPVTARGPDGETELDSPLRLGASLTVFEAGPVHLWDRTNRLDILMPGIALSGVTEDSLLAGTNRFAVETATGWEVIAARDASLIGQNTYRLSHLLRGLEGSEMFMADSQPAGARVLWLGSGVGTLALSGDWRGETITVTGETEQRDARSGTAVWNDLAGIPLPPAHLRWNGTELSWIACDPAFSDWTEDASYLTYRIALTRGSDVETIEQTETILTTAPFDRADVWQITPDGRESLYPAALNVH